MEKPSLTPHMDAAEILIQQMSAEDERQRSDPETNKQAIFVSGMIMPQFVRAMAALSDQGANREEVLNAFVFVLSNVILTLAASTGCGGQYPMEHPAVGDMVRQIMNNVWGRIVEARTNGVQFRVDVDDIGGAGRA